MRRLVSFTVIFIFLFAGLFNRAKPVYAAKYALIPPSGELTRGQEIQFIVTIDTQGKNLTSASVGVTYQTQYLQYISTSPGDAMGVITINQQGSGKFIINGSEPSGFSGQGDFAFITFKIIADAPGETELCALFAPTETPTPTTPGSSPAPTLPTSELEEDVPVVTNPPVPTRLPASGSTDATSTAILFALGLFGVFIGIRFIIRRGIH